MPSPIAPLMPYLHTFVFFAAYSVLYKNNPMYRFVQSLIVGVGAGYLLVAQIDAFKRGVVMQMFTGGTLNPVMILPWILGIGYIFIFIPRLINIYRAVSILTLTVGIGVVLPYGPAIFWTATQGYAKNALNFISQGLNVATLGSFVAAAAYGLALSYFFFTSVADKPTAPFRRVGRIVLLIYAAMCIVMTALGKINLVQWKVLDTIQGVPPTWWIPLLMFIGMLIDHFVYPLRNLVSRAPEARARS
ncbi:MAG: hypothetical protein QXT81_04410, partial [Candidatus Bathyarchaeia archaeon]